MDIFEALESPGFWILAGLGLAAEIIGYKLSGSWTGVSFPLWQLLVIMVVTVIASAFFATRE